MRVYFRRAVTAAGARRALGVYDVAYLAGGPHRVVECALISLAESGQLRFRATRVRAVGDELPEHPVERALITACPQSRRTASVCAKMWESPEVEEIGGRLVEWGLVTRARRLPTRVGRQRLKAAEQDGSLPAYVFDGPGVLPRGAVRRGVMDAQLIPSGIGRTLLRMGNALEHEWDSDSSGHSDSGSSFSCGGGGGGGGD
ncbi:TIGR04222 domain-containing membrane protein [Streptomyces sp. NPDC056486]|uniref:TIGR04222 domain-containing membrane protein n=1 Tax=Streptomyces sp. NPDC056486 TaxID=3345835 RepID=UPI0036872F97